MKKVSKPLEFILFLAKAQSVIARRFDSRIGGGIGFSDFMILYHLSQADDNKLRRIDLAEKIGLTASGVTRLLAPMEKIGLVSKEVDARDARVSYAVLAPGGRRLLTERLEKAELLSVEIISPTMIPKISEILKALSI